MNFYKAIVYKKVNCAPCSTLTRILPSLQAKHSHVTFEVIEVADFDDSRLEGVNLKSFPTTVLFDLDGNEIGRQPGALGVDQFLINKAV